MSDDEYSDYGEEWFYVEDAYTCADELAEHVVHSPPPMAIGDEDDYEEFDRFEYFYDLDYGSDDDHDDLYYDDTAHGDAKPGEKRKRGGEVRSGRKEKRVKRGERGIGGGTGRMSEYSPVAWYSQAERNREPETRVFDESAPAVALKVSEKLECPVPLHGTEGETRPANALEEPPPLSPAPESGEPDEETQTEPTPAAPDQAALMAAIQSNLAAAGGPLSDMDPQQLLEFAMRMMGGEAGDDLAGELADNLLAQTQGEGDDENEEAEAPADLLDWLSKQRNSTDQDAKPTTNRPTTKAVPTRPKSPEVQIQQHQRPITPPPSVVCQNPSSGSNSGNSGKKQAPAPADTEMKEIPIVAHSKAAAEPTRNDKTETRKRKAAATEATVPAPKKRATRSFDAPTASSRARAAPKAAPAAATTRTTRSTRSKRS